MPNFNSNKHLILVNHFLVFIIKLITMHKLVFLFLTAFFITSHAFSQLLPEKRDHIYLNYAVSSSIVSNGNVDGSPSLEGLGHTVGLSYSKDLSYSFGFETGIRYSKYQLNLSGIDGGGIRYKKDINDSYLTVPIVIEYHFLKYLFAQFGPTVSVQLQKNENINQSGIGILGSFGGKLTTKNMSFKAYPFYHSQSIISFSNENNFQSFQNVGFNIAVGYTF